MLEAQHRWPPSIEAINELPDPDKRAIYRTLIPDWVFERYGVDPITLHIDSHPAVSIRAPRGARAMEITVWHQPDAKDPIIYVNLADTASNQLGVLMLVVNDPSGPRFNIDCMPDGTPTELGTRLRNIPAEIAAFDAGLAPGQIRPGLRIFRSEVPRFEQFVRQMGHVMFFIEPLAYHNAIAFERYGFNYTYGKAKMVRLNAEFQPGGILHAQLDDSTHFRQPDAWRSVRGRSWAIHDGILGEKFDGFQMYKRIGHHAGINTFPNSIW
jgi:hypothetical protein